MSYRHQDNDPYYSYTGGQPTASSDGNSFPQSTTSNPGTPPPPSPQARRRFLGFLAPFNHQFSGFQVSVQGPPTEHRLPQAFPSSPPGNQRSDTGSLLELEALSTAVYQMDASPPSPRELAASSYGTPAGYESYGSYVPHSSHPGHMYHPSGGPTPNAIHELPSAMHLGDGQSPSRLTLSNTEFLLFTSGDTPRGQFSPSPEAGWEQLRQHKAAVESQSEKIIRALEREQRHSTGARRKLRDMLHLRHRSNLSAASATYGPGSATILAQNTALVNDLSRQMNALTQDHWSKASETLKGIERSFTEWVQKTKVAREALSKRFSLLDLNGPEVLEFLDWHESWQSEVVSQGEISVSDKVRLCLNENGRVPDSVERANEWRKDADKRAMKAYATKLFAEYSVHDVKVRVVDE